MEGQSRHFAEAASASALVLGGGAWFVDHYWVHAPLLLVDGVGIASGLIAVYAAHKWIAVLKTWRRAGKTSRTTEFSNVGWSAAAQVGNFGGVPRGKRSWGALKTTLDAEVQHTEEQLLKLKRGESPPRVERWLLPEFAAEGFAHPDMTAKRSVLRDRIRAAHLRAKEAEQQIQILGKDGAYNPSAPPDMQASLNGWRAKLSEAAYDGDDAKLAFAKTWDGIRVNIEEGLFDGKYVAKGFHHPDDRDGEVAIGKERWRVLNLDFPAAVAKRKADGSIAYTGVLIGKLEGDGEEREEN
jgi:hypothetical protein